jgi:hypothetical protein
MMYQERVVGRGKMSRRVERRGSGPESEEGTKRKESGSMTKTPIKDH